MQITLCKVLHLRLPYSIIELIFVNGITAEDIYDGTSKIRNRVLARIFKELGLIEPWGTGFMKMRESCESYGFPTPIIEEKEGPSVRLT